MKIGLVLDDTLDSSDGVQQYVLTLGSWFTKQGHEVHYLVGQTSRRDIKNIHSLSRNINVRFNGNRMSIPLLARRSTIKELLAAQQYDILHVQMPYSPFLAARIINAAPEATSIVGTFHIMPLGSLHRLAAHALQLILWRSTHRFSQVWSVSEPARQFAASLGIQSQVLPNAIDLAGFSSNIPFVRSEAGLQVVFLGRLVNRKGCMQLLKSLAELNKLKPIEGLKVKVGGKGPQLAKLQRYVQQHGLSAQVEFVGFVAEANKATFLRSADLAIFPSLGGESFGIVLLEAMAAGAGVVLAGNNPGYSSVLAAVPEALFDPTNPLQLAELISRLFKQPKLAKQLHERQQGIVKNYDVNQIGKKLLLYYQQLNQQ